MNSLAAYNVTERAQLFDSEQCVNARLAANLEMWQRSNVPHHSEGLEVQQQVYLVAEREVAYVRNQKAASRYLERKVAPLFDASDVESHLVRFRGDTPEALQNATAPLAPSAVPGWAERYFTFTVARDPIATAVDAYLEVDERLWGFSQNSTSSVPVPRFLSMPCGNAEEAKARYLTFLDEARRGEPLGSEFFHAFPQALKVDVALRPARSFDAVGVLEHLNASMQEIRALVGLARAPLPEETDEESHSNTDEDHAVDSVSDCSTNLDQSDPDVQQAACELYRVDYECFGYDLPAACSQEWDLGLIRASHATARRSV